MQEYFKKIFTAFMEFHLSFHHKYRR